MIVSSLSSKLFPFISAEAFSLTQGGVEEGGPELEPSKISCWQLFSKSFLVRFFFSSALFLNNKISNLILQFSKPFFKIFIVTESVDSLQVQPNVMALYNPFLHDNLLNMVCNKESYLSKSRLKERTKTDHRPLKSREC